MSGNEVHAVEELAKRVRALSDNSVQFVALRDRMVSELASKEAEVVELSVKIEMLTKVGELFRVLMDLMVVKQVRAVEDIVTEGLQSIFRDLDLSFEADVGPKYNKVSVDFFIRQGAKDDPLSHRGKPMEAFGGGPSSVASLVLRVLTVLRLKRWPFLVLDEALGAVSDEYTEPTGQFIQALAKKMGISVLLVTHKPAFVDHADTAYKCSEIVADDATRRLGLGSIK
jgi:hypothetical protein